MTVLIGVFLFDVVLFSELGDNSLTSEAVVVNPFGDVIVGGVSSTFVTNTVTVSLISEEP